MYDRLLKLLEAEGKKQQPEHRRDSPTSMVGGAGRGRAPKDEPWTPNVVIRDGKYVTLNQPSTGLPGSIRRQRITGSGAAMQDIHAGRRRRKKP